MTHEAKRVKTQKVDCLPKGKALLIAVLLAIAWLPYNKVTAQCTFTGNGFPAAEDISCITTGQSVDTYIPYNCFEDMAFTFTDPAQDIIRGSRMYLFRIDSIYNLPCGLSIDLPAGPIAPGETGCLHLHGTATDSAGLYNIGMLISFRMLNIPLYTHERVPITSVIPLNRTVTLRLKSSGQTCDVLTGEEDMYLNSNCQ